MESSTRNVSQKRGCWNVALCKVVPFFSLSFFFYGTRECRRASFVTQRAHPSATLKEFSGQNGCSCHITTDRIRFNGQIDINAKVPHKRERERASPRRVERGQPKTSAPASSPLAPYRSHSHAFFYFHIFFFFRCSDTPSGFETRNDLGGTVEFLVGHVQLRKIHHDDVNQQARAQPHFVQQHGQ